MIRGHGYRNWANLRQKLCLWQIEKKGPVSRAIGRKTVPRLPPAYFDLAHATLEVEKETRKVRERLIVRFRSGALSPGPREVGHSAA